MKTKVIFRKFPEGDVIAFFPDLPVTNDPGAMLSYQHIGQHGAAFYPLDTKPANSDEYVALYVELESIGYDLEIRKRATYQNYLNRFDVIKNIK